ncbi:glycoside hydrolase family 78 protein [Saccharicrinis sp. FJH54]|uniref:glycoside hydrolase family 78 protein n=1 Tax=Saccharicrinis sp. FJH54 TaxID=3344665 RepID=UPI0035D42A24
MEIRYKKLFFIFSLTFWFCLSAMGSVKTQELRCELLKNPLGIDTPNPRLSWKIQSDEHGVFQKSYHILVASSIENLDNNIGDLWDSGEVDSDQSHLVPYGGKELKSRTDCFWKVKTVTSNGESGWSETAYWSMGFLYYKDWYGRWIGFDRTFPWDDDTFHSRLSARYLRKEFKADKTVKKARAYLMGLGLYELYINGDKIGDCVLAPVPTDYHQNIKYNVYDVTSALKKGDNALGVILGNGRYHTMRQHYKPYKIKNFGFPKLLMQLEIEFTDGSKQIIKTDNSWKGTANGPLLTNNEYDGEEYDARMEMPGWNTVGFEDSSWLQVEYVDQPDGRYEAQMTPNMKVMEYIKPVGMHKISDETYVLDMGQNMVGWLRLKVRGKAGDKVKMRFSEILNSDGGIATENLRDAQATDVYTLKGEGTEEWSPRFIYHGFRYVEITGYPGIPTTDDFTGEVVYDNMAVSGTFETSNPLINRIYENATWSIKGNYKGMPVDCPQRNERQPWLGDRSTGCYGESFVYDNATLYSKWVDDIAYAQKGEGTIPDVAPAFWRYYSDNMTWPGTYLMVAEMLYRQYGDIQPLKTHYASMKKWMDYMQDRYMTEDFIMTKDSYGDWCAPPATIEEGRGKSANVKHPSELISTAYLYYYAGLMRKFAEQTGCNTDADYYAALSEKVKVGFNKKFFNPLQKGYGDNTLTCNLLALQFGLVPEPDKEAVLGTVVDIIVKKNNGHLSTGLIGTQWLMRTLTENGEIDLAYRIATAKSYPGWGYMVENGATTIWELWNGNTAAPNMNSYNHVMMLGDLIIWYYENLAGIKSDPENPGFKHIIMKPEIPVGLDHVKAAYESPYGSIESSWEKSKHRFSWQISIPANTMAKVCVPAKSLGSVKESGVKVTESEYIKVLEFENGRALLELGSGSYVFSSSL